MAAALVCLRPGDARGGWADLLSRPEEGANPLFGHADLGDGPVDGNNRLGGHGRVPVRIPRVMLEKQGLSADGGAEERPFRRAVPALGFSIRFLTHRWGFQ